MIRIGTFNSIVKKLQESKYYALCYTPVNIEDHSIVDSICAKLKMFKEYAKKNNYSIVSLLEATGNTLYDDLVHFTNQSYDRLQNETSTNIIWDRSHLYAFCWDPFKLEIAKSKHKVNFLEVIDQIVNFDIYGYGRKEDTRHSTSKEIRWIMQFDYFYKYYGTRCILKVVYVVRKIASSLKHQPVIRIITAYPLFYNHSNDRKEMFRNAIKDEDKRNNPGKVSGQIHMPVNEESDSMMSKIEWEGHENGILTEDDFANHTLDEIQEFCDMCYDKLDEIRERFFKDQVIYYLDPYNETDDYYVDRSWLNEDITIDVDRLKLYNIINCEIFNCLLDCYKQLNGSFPDIASWPQYLEARRSIARGDHQYTIYMKLVECFGQQMVDRFIIDKRDFGAN